MRRFAILAAASAAVCLHVPAASADIDGPWLGTWSAAPNSGVSNTGYAGFTIRNSLHISAGGDRVRVKLSNAFGTAPVRFAHVTIGLQRLPGSAAIAPGTLRDVALGGQRSFTIAAGEERYSDPVELPVAAGDDLLVSTFTPDPSGPVTYHAAGMTNSYFATDGTDHAGDLGAAGLPNVTGSWHYVTEVDTQPGGGPGAVVALGDSITDGINSTSGANRRWPDRLAARLRAQHGELSRIGVLNAGISGNRILLDGAGARATARLDRDVLRRAGVRTMIVLEGINDIQQTPHQLDPDKITAGLEELADRAHAAGLRVLGGTLTPFEGWSTYDAGEEAARQAVNDWIRHSGTFDGIVDFDAAVRDPADPHRMLPRYDSGDHLHPGDAGYQAMADAIGLRSLVTPTELPAGDDPAAGRSLSLAATPERAVAIAGRATTVPFTARITVRAPGSVKGTLTAALDGASSSSQSFTVASAERFAQVDAAPTIAVPSSTTPGEHRLTLTATTNDGRRDTFAATLDVERLGCTAADDACPVELAGAFDHDSIATASDPGGGGFDGLGWSYAAETLPAAGPVVLAATPFSFPSGADGVENTVDADGATIALPALHGDALRVLAASGGGSVRSTATLHYADGTTASAALGAADWAGGPAAGEDVAVTAPYRFRDPGGRDSPAVSIFAETVPLDPSRELRSVTLPGDPRMKIFAATVVQHH
ncbi:MAG TPA: SGNH/GDSL hydrolase family protein [Solirubrobacteraceae bacterium]|nr:SGNH/GDSL hydrolase family protein [Solirubrobacteraceae bacterium]